MKKILVKLASLMLLLSILTTALVSCSNSVLDDYNVDERDFDSVKADDEKFHVAIDVKNYGVIVLELEHAMAPITVKNFIKLVREGFYDGLTFHRVIENFMIQGGDPNGDGTGGAKDKIKGEFSANGWFMNSDLHHKKGVVSMARAQDNNSASSQFFICNADAEHLDGQYAAFGRVVWGMEVVDKITEETARYTNPQSGTIIQENKKPVINEMKVIVWGE